MSHQIPKTQTAAVVVSHDAPIQIRKDYPVKQPEELAPGECLVKLHCTGVCHTDLHARKGDWPLPSKLPLIGGHEGVGDVVAIGAHTVNSPIKIGDRVGIKWLADSCLQCEQCRKGLEQCPCYPLPVRTPNVTLNGFFAGCANCKLSGYTVDGTFSEYVVSLPHFLTVRYVEGEQVSYVHHVTPIPKGLSSEEAASFLCAVGTSPFDQDGNLKCTLRELQFIVR